MTEATQRTSDSGVSIWLDDLSRTRIESGNLQELIKDKNVVGVTTNPSIFQKALSQVGPYDAQLKELGKVDVETAIRELKVRVRPDGGDQGIEQSPGALKKKIKGNRLVKREFSKRRRK